MRKVLLGFLVFVIGVLAAYGIIGRDDAQRYAALASEWLSSQWHSVAYERRVEFAGLDRLEPDDLASLLPTDRSNFWWVSHGTDIGSNLVKHPLVTRASVRRCTQLSLGCFRIDVREEVPAYIALDKGKAWALGTDGEFLAPVSLRNVRGDSIELFGKLFDRPTVLSGVFAENRSPDLVRARIGYVRDALSSISDEIGMPVSYARLKDSGELEVKFSGHTLVATFDRGDAGDDRIRDEARRLKRLMNELAPRLSQVTKVDLAFNKLAVVGFADSALAP